MTENLEPDTGNAAADDRPAWMSQYSENKPKSAPPPLAAPREPIAGHKLTLAFLVAAVVALAGGLLWAAISIATGYNLGILALFIGAATGLAAHRVAGRPVGTFERALAGFFAGASIIIGQYVIVVHGARADFHYPGGYLDGTTISNFFNHLGTFIRGWDYVWIAFAIVGAYRTAGGTAVLGMGRARQR